MFIDYLIDKKTELYTMNDYLNHKSLGKLNIILRLIYRTIPFNIRKITRLERNRVPKPDILLTFALIERNNLEDRKLIENNIKMIIDRYNSDKTKYFAIKQNRKLHLKSYEADEEEIAPILTCWFGFLLIEYYRNYEDKSIKNIIISIADYFIRDLSKTKYLDKYIYFHYSPGMQEEIYNSSAFVSSFLVTVGYLFGNKQYKEYGKKGINCILKVQNSEGSWYYGEKKKYIDNFHTAFILLSLIIVLNSLY